jgi:two-component system response regulator FixJ
MRSSSIAEPRRAYVVDDDDEFRESLMALLTAAGWQARGFASALAFLADCEFFPPGALLLDVRMPELGGLEVIENKPACLVNFALIMISGHGDVDTAVRSLKAGAIDFIEKPFSGADLLDMLDSSYLQLISSVDHARRERKASQLVAQLSRRELDVLSGLVAGHPHKVIARNLGISDRTVEMYRNNLVRKLGAKSTNEALFLGILARVQPATLSQAT